MDRRTLLFLSLLPALSACERIQRSEKASRLEPSLKAFVGAIRWGSLDSAFAFVRPRGGAPIPPPPLGDLKVTGYDVQILSVSEDKTEAEVTCTFTYYFENDVRVATTSQTAVWYYVDQGRSWLMDAMALPDFRR